jgi:membrane protein DedA with SNARE-associated domain
VPPALVSLLAEYGCPILGFTVFFMNAGIPLPGHAAYVAACVLATRHILSLPMVFTTGATSAFFGAWLGFALGQRGGRRLVESIGPRVGLTAARLAAVERFFARFGVAAVFLTRFVIVIRTFGSVFAGVGEVPTHRFLLSTLAGALAWAGVYVGVAIVFQDGWRVLEDRLGLAGLAALAILALIGLGHVWWLHRKCRRAR